MTTISMEWNETGAVVKSTIRIKCPRCHFDCVAGVEHRCGDMAETMGGINYAATIQIEAENPVTALLKAISSTVKTPANRARNPKAATAKAKLGKTAKKAGGRRK